MDCSLQKMKLKMKVGRKLNGFERQKIGVAVLVGCFFALMTFFALPKPRPIPSSVSLPMSLHAVSTIPNSQKSEDEVLSVKRNSSTNSLNSSNREDHATSAVMQLKIKQRMKTEDLSKTHQQLSENSEESKPLCDLSDRRVDLCELTGDVRIHGNSSTITLVAPSSTKDHDSWRIRPYARKGDNTALDHVRELVVRSSKSVTDAAVPRCTANYTDTAVVFSAGGYAGNIFHDFTDILIPLFLTAHRFNGDVHLLVSDMGPGWWSRRYDLVLRHLSRHPVINLDRAGPAVAHCFPRAVVGLRAHKELSIDPARAPAGHAMPDFTRFMRRALSLPRNTPAQRQPGRKPRLLVIPRKRTRVLLNPDEVARTAEELGFEVVVAEPVISSDVAEFAGVVNSCDVVVGVHGAGLTNLVYLPTNGVLIQIVPWGGLEGIAMLDFGTPAKDMALNYMQYSISAEESSLIERYPRDHAVFKDPFSFHSKGWNVLSRTFINNQNVRVDVKRFRPVLKKAFELVQ